MFASVYEKVKSPPRRSASANYKIGGGGGGGLKCDMS